MQEIQTLLSEKRLAKYKDRLHVDALTCHLYNTQLAESFYTSLCYCEIVLRNKIDMIFSKYLGDDWLLKPEYVIGRNVNNMQTALAHIKDTKKSPLNKNHIISELTFGFWVYLFQPIYNDILWNKHPQMLNDIFDNARGSLLLNKTFYRLNRIKMYRNKTFHYGCLLSITDELSNPAKMHNAIYSILKDLNAGKILKELRKIDNFNAVYQKGIQLKILK